MFDGILVNKLTPYLLKVTEITWYTTICLLLLAGWVSRDQRYLVAESGIGYWFGIIGGSMMLILLIYPMRKRFRRWGLIGSVKSWFRIHMILGIAGPVIIIFHSGFKLGSFNSSVAFFCMLTVALSGLVGRKLYEGIHHGLYGSKVRFEEFYSCDKLASMLLRRTGIDRRQNKNGELPEGERRLASRRANTDDSSIANEYEEIEEQLMNLHTGINRSLGFYRSMDSRIRKLHRQIDRSALNHKSKKLVYLRLKDLRAICSLGTKEILFSYWHILHLPLFIMLILSGLVHVAAVHLY
ncbi:MAG: hypothetical protein GY785_17950 [Gammaproteobacteria bacterium]|nr:hypothetical protein [Gammaproteobacteria bacterium]